MLLEVGDKIYYNNGSHYISKHEITRVTKTRAYFDSGGGSEIHIQRDVKDGTFINIEGRWSRAFYSVESDKVLADYTRTKLIRKASDIKFSELSNDALTKIIQIAKNDKVNS